MPKGVYVRNVQAGAMPAEKIEDIKIEQKPDVVGGPEDREPDIVLVDPDQAAKDQLKELAFNEEEVTLVLERGTEKNAPTTYPFWVNGKGAEVKINGRWVEVVYLPTGVAFVTKRKYLAAIVMAKADSIETPEITPEDIIAGRNPERINRHTSSVVAFSVLEDRNPRGQAWLAELRRRNM